MMHDASHGRFNVVMVWACDRLARSTKHFLEVLDELHRLKIEFISLRENLDTGGPLGRAVIVIVSAIAELERSLIVERVRAGMRRAKQEGRRIGRKPLEVDLEQILEDRNVMHYSLKKIAKLHGISKTSVARVLKHQQPPGPKGQLNHDSQLTDNTQLKTAA